MIADEIKKLNELKEAGVLSEDEFNQAKENILGQKKFKTSASGELFGLNENVWLTLMNLSILAGFIVPILGLVLPFVLWLLSRDHSENADKVGRNLVNWIASFIIYFVICIILMTIFIGWLLLMVLVILTVIFVIIGAIKAANGEIWPYPLSIPFLNVESD
ncbi:DUF4870 domain-containing protein [Thiotrichales bacterium 19S3-7]|nr:DUF4870 domain-containing protein [Thiotrichales bacterium 19S3-7]MCF6800723.1 DUF4870 domain-containing protein [Thiotrichales bacterium 19S3-11]